MSLISPYTHAPVSLLHGSESDTGRIEMRICDLIKSQETYQGEMGQTVLETVRAMVERDIGAVPVVHNGKLVGIFSERDLMKRVVAEARDPRSTCLAEVMTDDPLTISMNDDLENCMALMRRHGFRHLPVCHEEQLVGIVSLRDILLHDLDEKEDEVRMMRAYIQSVPDA
jgi:signal-transduction protein with cAMP-binding, CBS, and nucleotidyltransferase domain